MSNIVDDEMEMMSNDDSKALKEELDSEVFSRPLEKIGPKPATTLNVNQSIMAGVKLMQEKKIGSILVTEGGKLVGIVTERDILLKVVGTDCDLQAEISSIMTKSPISLQKSDKLAYVLNNMHVGGYRHVPVVDENEVPTGIISVKDVIQYILDFFPKSVANLCDQPYRGVTSRDGG
ncbi:MAG: CBS domain-containing protein [Bdellovibrionales bacterium]|mgnify:CR=1 FL=1|jgi:CBS domain-containing protein|nr:CBS domain-containing protein [Bdellovibrionales bacterium]MBT3526894.1 CBS domain-containing protein [Bdellovibrionales bacterium]MBT7670451.1 CBS domain-containing protein [Bdellovibrionales bacterium]MBT7767235.1 CBS domain-containing protein [Bdellovibrionales bacterium]